MILISSDDSRLLDYGMTMEGGSSVSWSNDKMPFYPDMFGHNMVMEWKFNYH